MPDKTILDVPRPRPDRPAKFNLTHVICARDSCDNFEIVVQKMADKHISENSLQANSSILGEKIVSLASKQLDALCEETKKAKVARILDRKRKKWREKHKLETPPAQGKESLKQCP